MRRRWISNAAVTVAVVTVAALAAGSASADVVATPRRRPLTLALRSVQVTRSEAPEADARAVRDAVRRQLAGHARRLASCLANVDLREDPVRRRSRVLTGHMRFDRSGRPTVRIVRARGVPEAAQRCVTEVARAVSAPAPRGAVEIQLVYAVR